MTGCVDYPLGADYDSRAPWKPRRMRKCPVCGGCGHLYWGWDNAARRSYRCDALTYYALPEDDRDDDRECHECDGTGEVEYVREWEWEDER